MAGDPAGTDRAPGNALPLCPRSRSRGGLLADAGILARFPPICGSVGCLRHMSLRTNVKRLSSMLSSQLNRGVALIASDPGARAARGVEFNRRAACQGIGGLRLGTNILHRRCCAARGALLAKAPRARVRAGDKSGRMRILNRQAGDCREPPVHTVEARFERAPASNGRMFAGRSLRDARSARAGGAHRSRISSRRRDRVVAASDGPGNASRISADVVTAARRNRGAC
uniref:Hypothetical 24.0 kDa protein n=1 Tax=Bradyrhizobium sp. (strain WM9) TaxID=133505 RepID=Q9AQ04_BRASW|nr:hypothetical 24.0 kDa protein [Bradyrhizobium sp. WM9]